MNLESKTVVFSCYQKTVFIICSATSGGNDLWQNAKETVTRTKETSQLKH